MSWQALCEYSNMLVDNEAVLNAQAFDDFIEANFLPHVKSLYATTVKVHTNLEDVMKLLVQAIVSNERNESDVSCIKIQNADVHYQHRTRRLH